MNKIMLFLLMFLSCFAVFAQDRASLGASAKTNVTVVSNYELLKARRLFPLMKDETGEFVNDGGIIGSKIETDAIDEVAHAAADLSEAANTAMTNALGYVYEAMKDMARDSVGIAMAFAPEGEPSNLTVYVAHEKTNGTNDTMYVWFSEELTLAPNMFISYEYYGGCVTQKANWAQGWSTVTNIVDNRGRTWEGCHIATIERPTWAINVTCISEPNLPIGGPGGMNWGGITLLDADDMQPYATGVFTNNIDGLIMLVEDGAIKGIAPIPIGDPYVITLTVPPDGAEGPDTLQDLITNYGAKFIKYDGTIEDMTYGEHPDVTGLILTRLNGDSMPSSDAVVVTSTGAQMIFTEGAPERWNHGTVGYIQFSADTTFSVQGL